MHKFLKDFLVESSKSDKLSHHGYHRIYPWFLEHFRGQRINLLEIGLEQNESIKLWQEYFSKASIYGIDIDKKEFNDREVQLHQVDQSKEDQIERFTKEIDTTFDIIIDDGSHVPAHQILSLDHLWKVLSPGGVYIIEDIETSYWGNSNIYGYSFDADNDGSNFIRFAYDLIECVNAEFWGGNKSDQNDCDSIGKEIEIISFAYNCIILVKKDPESFSSFYNREYRFFSGINRGNQHGKLIFSQTKSSQYKAEAEQLLAEVAQYKAEIEQLRGQLIDLLTSRSWKFTSPLRATMSILRKIKKGL